MSGQRFDAVTHADSRYSIETIRPRKRLLFMAPIVMLLIGGIVYYIVQDAQEKIVRFQAVNVAEIVAMKNMSLHAMNAWSPGESRSCTSASSMRSAGLRVSN